MLGTELFLAILSAYDARSAPAAMSAGKRLMGGRSVPALGAGVLLVVVFLFGGSSRADVSPLLLLRPMSALLLVWALWTLTKEDVRHNKHVFLASIGILGLTAASLVPLPPSLWQALPGREIIVEIDSALGATGAWHPFTMTPSATFDSLMGLIPPLALVLFLSQMEPREKVGLAVLLAVLLGLSGAVEYLQAFGLPYRPYHISNENAGLFANRNHQALALACLIPLLAAIAATSRKKPGGPRTRGAPADARATMFLAAGGVMLIVPLIFIAGSRAGLVFAALGVMSALGIGQIRYPDGKPRKRDWKIRASQVVVGSALLAVAIWAAAGSDRNLAGSRLFAKSVADDDRFPIWGQTLQAAYGYLPFGSGMGSFVEIYQIGEPASLLRQSYINHAHNDLLELFLTTGVVGIAFMAWGLFAFGKAVLRTVTDGALGPDFKRYRWAGSVIVVLCVLASIVDYPLRTPAMACVLVYAAFLASLEPKMRRDRTVSEVRDPEALHA